MQTLWNSRDTLPAYPPLREDLHADAAVVGGGMAGILTAYAPAHEGLRVVLLEGSRLASGVTAHTTAKITAQHGRFCERLVHDFGFHLARQYLQANLCAVRQFRALVRQKRIDCGFSGRKLLHLCRVGWPLPYARAGICPVPRRTRAAGEARGSALSGA